VDEIQVDLAHAETDKALFGLIGGVLAAGLELRGDEHLVALETALSQRPADTLLIAVSLSSIDVPIPDFEGPPDGVDTLGPVAHLPHSKSK
jgi:hypothetical protein